MKKLIAIILVMTSISACSQNRNGHSAGTIEKVVGGQCQECEAVLEYGDKSLTWIDTLPDFNEPGTRLELSGTIFRRDGRTPAKDVILYIYHTDQNGKYSLRGTEKGWGARHGYIRGWIKTNADGKYKFYTLLPGAYPQGGNPAHIHPVIREPGVKEYWIDEYLFEGDPYLTNKVRQSLQGRGGTGILKTKTERNGMLIAQRDIILGLNVPGYDQ